jgi:hypothetical protein
MKKLSVTYHAPKGDNKVVEAFGHTFHDGKAEEVEVDDATLAKMQGNKYFECGKPTDAPPPKYEPPPKDEPHEKETHKGR